MNKKLIIIIALVVVVLGVGAGLYFFVFADDSEPPEVRVEYTPAGEFFTVNLRGSARVLRAGVVLVVNSEDLEEFLKENNNTIRDTIIFILRNLDEDEARAPGSMDILRERLVTALNEQLAIDNVVEIRFNDFVVA